MIRTIHGVVQSLEPEGVIIDVAGWGVFVHLAVTESLSVGSTVTLATHLVMRQDGPELYGFVDFDDRTFFELLLSVHGLGPKTALSHLRRAPREQLEKAIAGRDLAYLTHVVGLGKKSAEKLVVELSEKVTPREGIRDDTDADVFDMLVALGYTEREARKALGTISGDIVGREARLKSALSGGSH